MRKLIVDMPEDGDSKDHREDIKGAAAVLFGGQSSLVCTTASILNISCKAGIDTVRAIQMTLSLVLTQMELQDHNNPVDICAGHDYISAVL